MSYKGIGASRHPFSGLCDEWYIVFFNRMLPRTRIALFGANVPIELDWVFRKLACLLGLRTGVSVVACLAV